MGTVFASVDETQFKSWSDFDQFMQESKLRHENEGVSYMVSGTLAVLGGTAGYASEGDPLGRLLLSLTQSIGVAAIAYGGEQYFLGSDYQSFYLSLKNSSISDRNRSEILTHFLENERKRRKTIRWTRVLSHSLIAGLNFYQASQENNQNLKTGLNVLGVLNLGLAVHFSF